MGQDAIFETLDSKSLQTSRNLHSLWSTQSDPATLSRYGSSVVITLQAVPPSPDTGQVLWLLCDYRPCHPLQLRVKCCDYSVITLWLLCNYRRHAPPHLPLGVAVAVLVLVPQGELLGVIRLDLLVGQVLTHSLQSEQMGTRLLMRRKRRRRRKNTTTSGERSALSLTTVLDTLVRTKWSNLWWQH